jgi:hypothetical protein
MAFKKTAAQVARQKLMGPAANDEFDLLDQERGVCPDHTAPGESTTMWCAYQPKTLWGHTAKGRLLYLPRTEMVVVPFEMTDSGWNVVVVRGNKTYPRGGYHLCLGMAEIECAIVLDREGLGPGNDRPE